MKSYLKTSDYFLSKETYELLHDEELDMLITHPKPIDVSKYYQSDNYISHTDQTFSIADKLYQGVKKVNLRNKLGLVEKVSHGEHTLLDVGAGTGDFLLFAKNHGWEVSGVEPNHQANQLAREKGLQLKLDLKDFSDHKFSAITLWHVLEHLPDLKENIKQLYAMLEDDGTLIIAAPNFKSHDAKHYGKFWAGYDVPRHLWHFSKTAVQKMFSEYGLSLKGVRPMWFDSFYVSLLSEEYKTGKKNWGKALGLGLWSNAKGIFTREFSSHIYILQKANRRP
ncbi:MAG: class I SAM-dependent methyltransferase [Bacteroidota bacterium]